MKWVKIGAKSTRNNTTLHKISIASLRLLFRKKNTRAKKQVKIDSSIFYERNWKWLRRVSVEHWARTAVIFMSAFVKIKRVFMSDSTLFSSGELSRLLKGPSHLLNNFNSPTSFVEKCFASDEIVRWNSTNSVIGGSNFISVEQGNGKKSFYFGQKLRQILLCRTKEKKKTSAWIMEQHWRYLRWIKWCWSFITI